VAHRHPSTYLELHNQCYEAYNSNPLARQAIEITTSMVLGSGLKVAAHTQRVQRLLDRFWHDPDNHMDLRVCSLCTELGLSLIRESERGGFTRWVKPRRVVAGASDGRGRVGAKVQHRHSYRQAWQHKIRRSPGPSPCLWAAAVAPSSTAVWTQRSYCRDRSN